MQVVATVVPADASWSGLAAASQVADDFSARPDGAARRIDLPLASVQLDIPTPSPTGDPARPAISINYLRN